MGLCHLFDSVSVAHIHTAWYIVTLLWNITSQIDFQQTTYLLVLYLFDPPASNFPRAHMAQGVR